MTIPTITTPPEVPVRRNMAQDVFELATANFLTYFQPLTTDLTAFIAWVSGIGTSVDNSLAQVSALISTANLNANAILSRSSNTILGTGDNSKTIVCTAAFTQTLTAAATLGTGWFVYIRNQSSGTVVIDPNGAELINGAATYSVVAGGYCLVTCDGSAFTVINLNSATSNYTIEAAMRRAKNSKYY